MSGPRREHLVLVASATGYRLGASLRVASELARRVTVLTDGVAPLGGDAHTVDLARPDAAELVARATSGGRRVDAVVATDTPAGPAAALLAQALGLDANPVTAVAAAAHKAAQRRAVAERAPQVQQPPFLVVPSGMDAAEAALDVGFPAVVKPVSLTGSRGVMRVDDPLDARGAAHLARALVPPWEPLLVERFVPGGEVAVEGLLDGGRFHPLAVFDKPDAPQGPCFPETLLVTPSCLPAETRRRLVADSAAVCAAIGLRHGPVHVEFRLGPDGGPTFLELAARTIGGRCATMLRFARGRSLEELVLRQALRLPFDPAREPAAVGVWMLAAPADGTVDAVVGVEEARRIPGIDEIAIDVAPGDAVQALPHDGRYLGFIFARSDHPDAVVAALTKAATTIRIGIIPTPPH